MAEPHSEEIYPQGWKSASDAYNDLAEYAYKRIEYMSSKYPEPEEYVGDADTEAAIAGGIAAAYYGVPEEIIQHASVYIPYDMEKTLDQIWVLRCKCEDYKHVRWHLHDVGIESGVFTVEQFRELFGWAPELENVVVEIIKEWGAIAVRLPSP